MTETIEANALKKSMSAAPRFDESATIYDICFVMNVNSRGWILEKICRIIGNRSDQVCYYLFSERNDRLSEPLPRARNYVFAHFAIAWFTMKNHPEVFSGNRYVWYTHPDLTKGMTMGDVVDMARACTHVFTPCSKNRDVLVSHGIAPSHVSVPIGGADPENFRPKRRTGQGAVGFVGAYYARKQPDRMLELAQLLPHLQFILLGPAAEGLDNKGLLWTNWPRFSEFVALPNVSYVEAEYEDFPEWYAKFDVLCSTSLLEGGPIPAIEAMMSNVIPVLSDTGFARDIIEPGRNGFIFPVDASATEIAPLLERAMAMTDVDVAADAALMSWDHFGSTIWDQILPPLKPGQLVELSVPEDARRYLSYGFHPTEARGVWMRAHRAQIELPVAADVTPEAVELFVWAPGFIGEAQVSAKFSVNGGGIREEQIGTHPKIVRLPVPPLAMDEISCRKYIRIEITLDRSLRARDWDTKSSESRNLGLKLGWCRVL